MKREERRGAYADGDLPDSFWTEEERPESAEQPVPPRQVRRPLASPAQDDQLLLEQEILRDHGAHATGATQLRGHDGQVKQGEQEVLHARDSVGQTSGATQRCLNRGFSERIGNSRPTGEKSARTTASPDGLLVVDYDASGHVLGVEITAPQAVPLERLNAPLVQLGQLPSTEQDYRPARAA